MSFRKLLLCVGAVAALAGCDGGGIDRGLLVSGPSPTLNEAAAARLRERQDLLVTEISRAAGLGGAVPNSPQQWREFGWAAFDVADEQCEAYLGALRRLEVERRRARRQVNLLGTATAGILGAVQAAGAAVAITATAFGLVEATIDNYTGSLLYELPASSVRGLVETQRAAYEATISRDAWASRAATFRIIRGYVELCLPTVIEANAAQAVSSPRFREVPAAQTGGGRPRIRVATTGEVGTAGNGRGPEDTVQPVTPATRRVTDGRNEAERRISLLTLRTIRAGLCLPPPTDGRVTSGDLQEAVRIWRQKPEGEGREPLTQEEIIQLGRLPGCERGRYRNHFERTAYPTPVRVKCLERQLGVTETGDLNSTATRQAIRGRAATRGFQSGDQMTAELLATLPPNPCDAPLPSAATGS